jgi:hypothetical protein
MSAHVNRFVVVAGAVALSFVQPAISFAQPPPAPVPVYHSPVYHAAPVYHPAAPAQPSRAITQARGNFTLPIDFNLRPRPFPQTLWEPSAWGLNSGFLSQPCIPSGSYWGPWGLLATPNDPSTTDPALGNVTLGSLVDGHSRNLFTSQPSYGQSSALTTSATAPVTSGPTLQYGFQTGNQFGCGPAYSFSL